ncbi:MAG TPA: hypothetical protein VGL81_03855 [Polyangiaceae bacterium]|jgi:hypothetical protein
MNLFSQLGGLIPFAALAADPMFATDRDGDSGTRTVVGALSIIAILGLIIFIGTAMGRGERT